MQGTSSPAQWEKRMTQQAWRKVSTSPWPGVRERYVCVKPPKETELNSLPKFHLATWERTRKEEKGKCTETVAIFSGEWIWRKYHPSPQGCYSSGVWVLPFSHANTSAQMQPAQFARATHFGIQQHIRVHSERLGGLKTPTACQLGSNILLPLPRSLLKNKDWEVSVLEGRGAISQQNKSHYLY